MGIFTRAADRAAALVDRVMAESVRIHRADNNLWPFGPFEVQGCLVVGMDSSLSPAGSADVGQAWSSRLPSEAVELDVDPVAWPAILTVRAGDTIVALERGNATYQVLRRKTAERNRIVFILAEA
jgi:hypothetical protein